MKTDIEIAQESVLEPITKVASQLGIAEDDLELYGKYKAKLSNEYIKSIEGNPDGKLILVTAINPTPSILLPRPTTTLRSTRSFISRQRFQTTCLVSIPSSFPCWIWLSSKAASKLLAEVMA